MDEINRIASSMRQAFEKDAWHGPSVKEALADISAEIALTRIAHTHSIIELVAHMAAWKTFTNHKITGDSAYQVTDALNFPHVSNWTAVVKQLDESHAKLITSVSAFPEDKLNDVVPNHNYTFYTLLHGIIQHDLYHTGQIMLIKRSLGK
jgi:uncharacterized damage-inducible protein DinB